MKERKNNKIGGLLVVLLALGLSMSVVGTAVAQTEIPAGATINSAWLWVYADDVTSAQTVTAHRVTAYWEEETVTWGSFAGSYDAVVVDQQVVGSVGWHEFDVTALVLAWVDGDYPNYGVLLDQQDTSTLTRYAGSESSTIDWRPILEINYTVGGIPGSVMIQEDLGQGIDVDDAYIYASDINWIGDPQYLYTGLWPNAGYQGEKQSLLRFDFISVPRGGGGLTPGFWQNKHGLGLIEDYDLLGMINDLCLADDYGHIADFADTKAFKAWIKKRNATNMAYQLSGHLAAMKLNVAVGYVDGGALVYLNMEGDMISINNLMAYAAAALCEDGYTPAGDENRDYQELLKDALDYANNNLNWVNP